MGKAFNVGITNFNSNVSLYGIQNRASANTISGGNLVLTLTNHANTQANSTIGVYNQGNIDFDLLDLDITSNTTSYGLWGVHSGNIDINDLRINIDTVTLGQKTDTSDDVAVYLSGEQGESLNLTSDSITIELNSSSGAFGFWTDVTQAQIEAGNLTVTGEAQGRIYGLLLEDNTSENEKRFTADTVFMDLKGHNGYATGIVINGANYVNTLSSAEIHVQSDGENGIVEAMQILGRQDAHSTVNVTGDLTLTANSKNSNALGALFKYSDMTVDGALTFNVHSDYVATPEEDTLMVSGLVARDDSQINVNGAATINVSNNNAHMVSVLSRDNATITFNNTLNATMSGKTDVLESTVLSAIGGTISATHGGVINANGGLAARVAGTDLSGEVRQGHIILASDDTHTLQIFGDLYAQNESTIDATLGEGSQFVGSSETNGQGQINLTLNGGQWTPTSRSSVSHLNGEGGLVDLSDLTADDDIAVDRYSGDHRFYTEDPSGASVTVTQKDAGSQVTVMTDAQTNDNFNHTEDLVEALSIVVTDANGETLVNRITAPESDLFGAVDAVNQNGTWTVNRAENLKLQDYFSAASLSVLAWRHQFDDYHERMGEIRDNPDATGVWARVYGSEFEYGKRNAQTQNTTVEVGADTAINSNWRVGGAFSYTDGDYDLLGGSGDNKAYSVGAYAIYLSETGVYFDVMAKYSRLDVDFDIGNMAGSYDNNGLSVSAEAGHKFAITESFFIEPQVGVSYGYLKGDSFTSSNNVSVDQDDFNSLVGRVGVRAGFAVKDKVSVYAKASVLHDFTGDLDTRFTSVRTGNSVQLTDDFEDTWVEYGAGADFAIRDNLKTYAEFERSSSGSVDENWRFNVGMRYVF